MYLITPNSPLGAGSVDLLHFPHCIAAQPLLVTAVALCLPVGAHGELVQHPCAGSGANVDVKIRFEKM